MRITDFNSVTGGDGAIRSAVRDDKARDGWKGILRSIDESEKNLGYWDGDRHVGD